MSITEERKFLLLMDDTPDVALARRVLKSPLELAEDIISKIFDQELTELRMHLDSIKSVAAGVKRATDLQGYSIANYYSVMFAFQQWFHSSYRARQGKFLEAILQEVLKKHSGFSVVHTRPKETKGLVQKILGIELKEDIDVAAATDDYRKALLIQIRSRDDTGGTTAKGSLVDALRSILRISDKESTFCASDDEHRPADVLYLVAIWEEGERQQQTSTIHKMYNALGNNISLADEEFSEQIAKGIEVAPHLYLRLAYGLDELLQAIYEWDETRPEDLKTNTKRVLERVEQWDDLWLAYAVATLEIQAQTIAGVSNVSLLNKKCCLLNIELDYRSYQNLVNSIEEALQKLIPVWTEETLPVRSPAEQRLYLRDLLFLRAIYEKSRRWSVPQESGTESIRESPFYYQMSLFETTANPSASPSDLQPVPISFRSIVPEIRDTNYLTHGIFYYPAKFIPHVPRFCLQRYTRPGDWVIDPFAGSGTVGLEAVLTQRSAVLMDINPLLSHIVPLKILWNEPLESTVLQNRLDEMRRNRRDRFIPEWSNLEYWYDAEILEIISYYWGWVKQQPEDGYTRIIEAALLRVSRQFSYTEHRAPKLFRSRRKQAEMEAILQGNWKESLDRLLQESAFEIYKNVQQLRDILPHRSSQVLYYGGVDSTDPSLFENLGIIATAIITSPPYLQAQEYIRTFKLDLFWLGYSENDIRQLAQLEIPYRRAPQAIHTPTLDHFRNRLIREDLKSLVDSYFYFTLQALENSSRLLSPGGVLCVFVGNPKVDGIEVETWRVFSEYFHERGFVIRDVFEDRIKNRQLFRGRKNKNPEGMESEYLAVMEKVA